MIWLILVCEHSGVGIMIWLILVRKHSVALKKCKHCQIVVAKLLFAKKIIFFAQNLPW